MTNRASYLMAFLYWLLATSVFLCMSFYFDCEYYMNMTLEHFKRGVLLMSGLALVIAPFARSLKQAACMGLGATVVLMFVNLLDRYETEYGFNWNVLGFRYFLDTWAHVAIVKLQCLVFPDTYFCIVETYREFKTWLSWPMLFGMLSILVYLACLPMKWLGLPNLGVLLWALMDGGQENAPPSEPPGKTAAEEDQRGDSKAAMFGFPGHLLLRSAYIQRV